LVSCARLSLADHTRLLANCRIVSYLYKLRTVKRLSLIKIISFLK